MKAKVLITILASLLVISVITVVMLIPADAEAKENIKTQSNDDKMPPGLKNIPPGLEKIVFIHYKKGHAKPDKPGKPDKPNKPGEEKGPQCYSFLGKGVKWKDGLPTSCVIHPDLEEIVPGAIIASAETWDSETSQELFDDNSYVTNDSSASWDDERSEVDGRNELVLGDYKQEGVIAVTVVWGYFSGPPDFREIFEFDILFDTDFTWGDATTAETTNPEAPTAVMDLQNIATHELGHGLGLADIYQGGCSEVTMYGYSEEEEIKKRTLDSPDIAGIRELYGE